MNEIDFRIEKLEYLLGQLKVAWKTKGCPYSCEDELTEFTQAADRLETTYYKLIGYK